VTSFIRNWSFSLRNLFLFGRGGVRRILSNILVPVVLFYSHCGSVLLHRPVISARGAESRIMVTIRASSPLFRYGKSASVFFIGGIMANYGRIVKLLLTVKRENGRLDACVKSFRMGKEKALYPSYRMELIPPLVRLRQISLRLRRICDIVYFRFFGPTRAVVLFFCYNFFVSVSYSWHFLGVDYSISYAHCYILVCGQIHSLSCTNYNTRSAGISPVVG